MGIGAITTIKHKGIEYCHLYRHSDGYPSCHGNALAKFLKGKKFTDGFLSDDRTGLFNGPECLAAQLVAHFKVIPGLFYLAPKEVLAEWGDPDYTYVVAIDEENKLSVEVWIFEELIFCGTPSELHDFEDDLED